MNTYFLRCRESRLQTLIERGIRLGAIEMEGATVTATFGGSWDYIGIKQTIDENGNVFGEPLGGIDDPYVHINLRTPVNLRDKAIELAQAGDADIASGLAEIANYFITDAEGNAGTPEFPIRIFC